MAAPLRRDQLSNYVARRVYSQAETLVALHSECQKHDWSNGEPNRQFLDASEKLSKLASKLPRQPYAELALKISSLLKLGNIEDKPSYRSRTGIDQAVKRIAKHVKKEARAKSKSTAFVLKKVVLQLKQEGTQTSLLERLKHTSVRGVPATELKELAPGTCLLIDIEFIEEPSTKALIEQALNTEHCLIVFLCADEAPELAKRLAAVRAKAQLMLSGDLSANTICAEINHLTGAKLPLYPEILVLDDSVSQLKFTENMLKRAGFESRCVSTPQAFLDEMESKLPDLVLLDMYLPSCTGEELALAMKQNRIWQTVPIIFLSAEEDETVTQTISKTINAPFLTKPVKPQKLAREIEAALQYTDLETP